MSETYVNEGFLYIRANEMGANEMGANEINQEQFIKGRIIDSDNTLVCPGEIIPQLEDFPPHNEIQYYSPILKGRRVRIYYYNSYWHISTVNKIYPTTIKNDLFIEQVNSDLLDINKVYYATYTDEDILILTYLTEKKAPALHIPDLQIDHAFKHHLPLIPFDITQEELEQMIKTLQMKWVQAHTHIYGITLFTHNGNPYEVWSKQYHIIKAMEKPDNVSIYDYYFHCLNKYPLGAELPNPQEVSIIDPFAIEYGGLGAEPPSYEQFISSVMCDINEFIIYYPEHKEKCDRITQKIEEYVLNKIINNSNEQKIATIKYLLSLDIENSISLISPMPSRRNSFI